MQNQQIRVWVSLPNVLQVGFTLEHLVSIQRAREEVGWSTKLTLCEGKVVHEWIDNKQRIYDALRVAISTARESS